MINLEKPQARILIIDDDQDFSNSVRDILRDEGYQIQEAHTRDDALLAFADFSPNIVLIDIKLGKENGVDLLSSLKSNVVDGNYVEFIMMTAFSNVQNAIKALRNGAFDYLQKPVPPEKMIHAIQMAAEKIYNREKIDNYQKNLESLVKERTCELEESNLMYKLLSDASPVGMFKTNEHGKIEYANQTWLNMCGFSFSKVSDAHWTDLICLEHQERVTAKWDEFLDSDQAFEEEFRIHNTTNNPVWVYAQAKKNKKTNCIIGSFTNITNHKEIVPRILQIKEEIRQSRKDHG